MSTATPKIGIAIVQWNHSNLTLSLLDSLLNHDSLYRIAICDNGSSQEHICAISNSLEKHYKSAKKSSTSWNVKLICNRNNSGYARAMNQSIQCLLDAGCEWIWLLNNDVSIDSKTLIELPKSLSEKKEGLYGMTIEEQKAGKIIGGYIFNFWTTQYRQIKTNEEFYKTKQQNKYISGASLIIHRKVITETGLLNEKSFLYFEELDYTFRARSFGYQQFCLDNLTVKHIGSASSSSPKHKKIRMYHETWSMLCFYAKHKKWLFAWIFLVRNTTRIASLLVSNRFDLISTVIKACTDFLLKKNPDLMDVEIFKLKTFTKIK